MLLYTHEHYYIEIIYIVSICTAIG